MTVTVPDEVVATLKDRAQVMLHRLVPGKGICNFAVAIRVDTRLRWWPLQAALDHVLWRHPALRATIRTSGPTVLKRYLAADSVSMPLQTVPAEAESLDELITHLVGVPFDIDSGEPLIRAHHVMLPGSDVVLIVMHHILGDGAGAAVVRDEVGLLYDAFARDGEAPPELTKQTELFVEDPLDDDTLAYWQSHLHGVRPETQALAHARPTPARPTFAGDWVEHRMSPEAFAALGRLRSRTRVTGNIVLLATYYLALTMHGAGPDLVVGVLKNARRSGDEAVGYHVNTLPLRVCVDLDADFATLVTQTRDVFFNGLENDVSYELMQHRLDHRSADWRVPLFRHAFNHMPRVSGNTANIAGATTQGVYAYHGMSRLDLELFVWAGTNEVAFVARYSTEVLDREFVSTLMARIDRLLIALDRSWGLPVGRVDCDTEPDSLLRHGLRVAGKIPADTVPAAVSARVAERPESSAVDGHSYARLSQWAGAVAERLRESGVRKGDIVGLYAARGGALAAAVLGVWAAGAAYLPLEPTHPADRAVFELDDAGVRVVLSDRVLPSAVGSGRTTVDIASCTATSDQTADTGPDSDDPAYVIYTSGSTGRPKGVVVSHANLANVVNHFISALEVTDHDRVLWLTTFSFDISALELLLPLVAGGTSVVAPDDVRADPDALLDLVVRENATVLQATPTLWRHLGDRLDGRLGGRRVLSGGEALTAPLAEHLLADGCRLFNVYGPTETTIWSTAVELASPVSDPVPIGLPIAGTSCEVTDASGRSVPIGVPGELRIGGLGVAIGYHNDPRRTADRFPIEPQSGRVYRTGDIVRVRADGMLEYLGRTDRQVKIRGHRVELGEIETVLENDPDVHAAAVFTETDPSGHLRLVAAIRPADPGTPVSAERLAASVARSLPAAMSPNRYVFLPRFPQTGNGKVDYGALATMARPGSGGIAEPPADPLERTLLELWRELLGDDRLTVDANFFLSGGHSLLAIQLADRIAAVAGRVVEFDAVFEAPTPVEMAQLLKAEESR